MQTATFNTITFSYDIMQTKVFEFKILEIYSNVMILDPGNSNLRTGETMNDLIIESVMSFNRVSNCITN
jgi:hypothetical protein